ncbi:hypothetical protein DC094_00945 [Pelagibaculum spongiae]|uniref:Polyphosphate kinase-2-related domain-containing protein n=2 Tax=Pelagibaculum spongiae TaxID=2080658 RepID=A0A2V1H7U8_9GAMM|nr:hypothetical protein DC094_00945 [Pelagibaculum spongiae]
MQHTLTEFQKITNNNKELPSMSIAQPEAKIETITPVSNKSKQPLIIESTGLPKLGRKEYEREKRKLQIELIKMQNWVKTSGEKVIILFEGRDAAGKGSAEPVNNSVQLFV